MGEWISVDERTPENNTEILCLTTAKYRIVATYSNGDYYDDQECFRDISHWMPLPEPPVIIDEDLPYER